MKYNNYALLSALASAASAHSWIEQLLVIGSNGTMGGVPGFARGNVLRTTPGFSDPQMVNLIPPDGRPINQIFSTDLMCKNTQTINNQTEGSPRLQASAGDNIALRYQENGHVTLPQNQPGKPNNRGTIFVYGTTQPQPDDAFLSIHRVWNAAGTGGDRRGVLLSTQNFDDSQCYQVNSGTISEARQKSFAHPANQLEGADLWCQQDIQIPSSAPSGKPYTLYWVWDWPTLPGTPGFPDGKQEIYTTCMDIDITDGSAIGGNTGAAGASANDDNANENAAANFIVGQNFASAAVKAELEVISNPTAVSGQFIPFSSASGAAGSLANGAAASTPAETAAATTPTTPAAAAATTGNTGGGGGHHHHSRPSVSPIGSLNNGGGNDNNDNGNGNNNNGNNNDNTATANAQPSTPPQAQSSSATAPSETSQAGASAPPPSPPAATDANANGNPPAPTVTQVNTIFNTVTQTTLETVFVTPSALASAGQGQGQGQQKRSEEMKRVPSVKRSCRTARGVGKLRLKARLPFYILPGDDDC